MLRTIIIALFTVVTFSCTDINQGKNTISRLEKLQMENDSLRKIVADINTKFVFDSISFRDIPNIKNTYEINSNITGEIVFIGYNVVNKTNLILADSVSYNPKKIHNPDTLKIVKGGYQYNKVLDAERIDLQILAETKNVYGQGPSGNIQIAIKAKKN